MKKLVICAAFALVSSVSAFASDQPVKSHIPTDVAVAIAASPLTMPATLLAAPYQGWTLGWDYTTKIDNEIGRTAVRVAMAPLLLPAAILNIPSALLSPTGLTTGY